MDTPTRDRLRVNLIDLLGYAGAAAALAATTIAVGEDASESVQALTGLVTTAVLLLAGWLIGAGEADPQHRMRSVLWGVALLAWIGVVVVTLTEVIDGGPEGKWLVALVAFLTAALAFPLWWVEKRSIQFIGLFVSLQLCIASMAYTEETLGFLGFEQKVPDLTLSAIVTMLFGLAGLGLGARSLVTPRRTAMVLGAIALILGALFVDLELLEGGPSDAAIWAAIVASAVVIVIGNLVGERAPAGVGIAGLFFVTAGLVSDKISEQSEGIVVVIVGLVLLGVAVVLARMKPSEAPAEPVEPLPSPPES